MATTQNGFTDKTKDRRRIKRNCAAEADLNWASKTFAASNTTYIAFN